MYSMHGVQFDRLIELGMSPDVVHILRSIFTNPDVELTHNGKITLRGPIVGSDLRPYRWAKATYNWEHSGTSPSLGGGRGWVMARECEDLNGNHIQGDLVKIYLPTNPGQDPNVITGDVIGFSRSKDGTYVASGYGDDRVGSIRMGVQGDKGVRGWGVMDGTKNSKVNGGSGLNAGDKFMRMWTSTSDVGNTGGAASNSTTVAVTDHNISDIASGIGTHSGSDVAGTLSDHPASGLSHKHEVSDTTIGTGTTSTVGVLTGDSVGGTFYTKLANAGGSDLAHSGSGSLSHSGSGTISHTVTVNGGSGVPTIPPYMYVAYLERLDNSRTRLGD